MTVRVGLWVLMAAQMLAWAWFSLKGGKLSKTQFMIFSAAMVLGQAGTAVETWLLKAWGSFVVQIYFFLFTVVATLKRARAQD